MQGLLAYLPFSTTSKPSLAQVQKFLDDTAGEINGALGSHGLSVPITAPAWFLAELVSLNAQGAAWLALTTAFPQSAGPTGTSAAPSFSKAYHDRLNQLRQGVGIPTQVTVAEADRAPRSYALDEGLIGTGVAGGTDSWGDASTVEPAFRRGQVF